MKPSLFERLIALYPALRSLPQGDLQATLSAHGQLLRVPAGAVLFDNGSPCRGFPLVFSGSVRVARGSAGGRQIELYRVTPGEVCVVSSACLFGGAPLSALGQAAEDTELVLIDPVGFAHWCGFESFRRFVFSVFAERLADLMALTEAVAFQRLDQRLAQTLLGHGEVFHTTHQALADDLGTVREIVSRLLNRFEAAGWLRLFRERIEIVDAVALRDAASGLARAPTATAAAPAGPEDLPSR